MRICPNALLRPFAGAAAVFAVTAFAGTPLRAAEPIVLSIIDTGGDLASTQVILENYKKANPDKIKEIRIQRAPAPELPAKIKAQQDAGRLDINLVLTGQDGGAFLAANNQLIKIPDFEKQFPRDEMTPARRYMTRGATTWCRQWATLAGRCSSTIPARSPIRRKPPKNCWPGRRQIRVG